MIILKVQISVLFADFSANLFELLVILVVALGQSKGFGQDQNPNQNNQSNQETKDFNFKHS